LSDVSQKGNAVASYWAGQTRLGPVKAIHGALQLLGKDPTRLRVHDASFLSSLDEFHCLGLEATDDLARLVGLARDAHVLDLGCGLGGPARRLAMKYGCRVVGIDITQPFLTIASGITETMGLNRSISFARCDATDFSFAGHPFDVGWMQVTAANVGNRTELYRNIHSVLREGGKLAIYDIFQTPGSHLTYPVPWSKDGSTSALYSEEETIALGKLCGFVCTKRLDVSIRALRWFENQRQDTLFRKPDQAPQFGFPLLLPRWLEMTESQISNLKSGTIRFGYLVFDKA
jgi:MPBQ/MSBQ methyltransferase